MLKILCVFILFIFSNVTSASEMKVVFVKPPVVAKRLGQDQIRPVAKGQVLRQGDRAQVKGDGLLVLKENGGSTVKLEGGSIFEITKLKEGNSSQVSLYSLARGAAFFFTPEGEEQSEKLRVRTSTASFAVRGTQFFVAYGEGEGREDDVWMCVNEGVVESLSSESQKPVAVKAGEGIQVSSNGKISPPRFLPWTKKLNWNNDPRKGDLKNRVSIEEAYASPLEMDFD